MTSLYPIGMESIPLHLGKGMDSEAKCTYNIFGCVLRYHIFQSLAESIDSPVLQCQLPSHYQPLYTCSLGRSCYYGNTLFLKTEAAPGLGSISEQTHTSKEG